MNSSTITILSTDQTLCEALTNFVNSVVAIHGLGADPEYSWSVNSGNGKRISWLKERKLLPGKFPNAQMLAFNHTADWLYYHPTITASRSAEELLEELKERQLSGLVRARSSTDQCFLTDRTQHRPIILIGHSYGGNIVKDVSFFYDLYPKVTKTQRG